MQRQLDNSTFWITAVSYGLGFGLGIASLYWLIVGLFQSASSVFFDENQRILPNQGIRRSLSNALRFGLFSSIISFVIFGLASELSRLVGDQLGFGFSNDLNIYLNGGLTYGLDDGLVLGGIAALYMGGLAWFQHWLLRFHLESEGAISSRYVHVLDEAAQRILLRKSGGGYRFLHDLFRDYLASLDPPPSDLS